jgi:hypothetical protein
MAPLFTAAEPFVDRSDELIPTAAAGEAAAVITSFVTPLVAAVEAFGLLLLVLAGVLTAAVDCGITFEKVQLRISCVDANPPVAPVNPT